MTCSPILSNSRELKLPVLKQPSWDAELGFQSFYGNKSPSPFTWNLIMNLKEESCTVVDGIVIVNEKNKFVGSLKILYLKIATI